MRNSSGKDCLVTPDPEGKTLFLTGELNYSNAKSIYNEFTSQMDGRIEQVDCSGLEHADSTALALLLIATDIARVQQRDLMICGLSSRLSSLVDVYGITELLNVVP